MMDRDLSDRSSADADAPRQSTSDFAMLLLQFAAARAEIGHFARRDRETPQMAARCYEVAAHRGQGRKARLA